MTATTPSGLRDRVVERAAAVRAARSGTSRARPAQTVSANERKLATARATSSWRACVTGLPVSRTSAATKSSKRSSMRSAIRRSTPARSATGSRPHGPAERPARRGHRRVDLLGAGLVHRGDQRAVDRADLVEQSVAVDERAADEVAQVAGWSACPHARQAAMPVQYVIRL